MIYVEAIDFMTRAELAAADDRRRHRQSARAAEFALLKAASPLRSMAAQHDVGGLALFDVARQPALI